MKTSWTAGLDEEKQEVIRSEFRASGILRERLTEMLTKKIDSVRREKINKNSYEIANWGFLQADLNGYERAMTEIISILSNSVEKE